MFEQAAMSENAGVVAAEAPAADRMQFIRQTYTHLGGAIILFMLLELRLLDSELGQTMASAMLSTRWSWLLILGGFVVVGNLAERFARSERSVGLQYAGLGLYVVAEAVIFLPFLMRARVLAGPEVIPTAALITGIMFAGLTAAVFVSGENFNWLRGALAIGSMAALGTIVCSIAFGFHLGMLFSAAMVLLACGYILYYTSKIQREFRIGSHVAAALALFAAVMLLFWYVVRILMSRRR
jgi:FtsH-binding integral membrane protein